MSWREHREISRSTTNSSTRELRFTHAALTAWQNRTLDAHDQMVDKFLSTCFERVPDEKLRIRANEAFTLYQSLGGQLKAKHFYQAMKRSVRHRVVSRKAYYYGLRRRAQG